MISNVFMGWFLWVAKEFAFGVKIVGRFGGRTGWAARAGREPEKALLALAFRQAKIFPSGYGVFGRKSSVFWQNGTRQPVPVMDHRIAPEAAREKG
jgi:hypothetical protein